MKELRPAKRDKKEIKEGMHLARPPRLEGMIGKVRTRAVRKPPRTAPRTPAARKPQGYTARQRKEYQLPSKK